MRPRAWIPLTACEDRRLYRVHARNFRLAVFRGATGSFLGIRGKYGQTFVDEEYHYDAPEWATAAPLEALPEVCPAEVALEPGAVLLAWLEDAAARHP